MPSPIRSRPTSPSRDIVPAAAEAQETLRQQDRPVELDVVEANHGSTESHNLSSRPQNPISPPVNRSPSPPPAANRAPSFPSNWMSTVQFKIVPKLLDDSDVSFYKDLPNETTLTPAEAQDAQCSITMKPLSELDEPVAIRSRNAVHVFEWSALENWLSENPFKPTNPMTREELTDISQIMRVNDD